ncbi:MAG: polysulfide reductase NrfD [gamma proteobacterium symbiont of Bathyaustriella thionipta]|nr:polysulfide reductase NrfD [gamma proteobacterium symbiont of Bathyaustriella thionipta]
MKKIHFLEWGLNSPRYWGILAVLAAIAGIGGLSALYMEHNGHWVTGMSNQVVWGMPHIFAIFLIVAASGALNVASIASVFGKTPYKPLARLSAVFAVTLLIGGLLVLVLDLGRPDRLIVAMTTYNFKSIFAWNILLYTGFMVIVIVYLFTMMERKAQQYNKAAGTFAFIWRLTLTTGTGSIFGFIVARQAFDAAIMAPMFVIMSFSFGLACFLLLLMYVYRADGRELGDSVVLRLKNLLGVFVASVFYFTLAYHLTNLYATENHSLERFILLDGGVYTNIFWIGQIFLGTLVPLGILYHPSLGKMRNWIAISCGLVVLGAFSQLYVIIIGGQAFPMQMFPGKTIIESGFYDGVNGMAASYAPTLAETLLGIGGVSVAVLMALVVIRMLPILPISLADKDVDPHAS